MIWQRHIPSGIALLCALQLCAQEPVNPTAPTWESLTQDAARHFGEGRLPDARHLASEALEYVKENQGVNIRAAESHYLLGEIYNTMARYDDAVYHARRALLMRSKLLGVDHVQVGFSANSLAQIHQDNNAFQRALPLNEQAIIIWRNHFGENHPHLSVPYNNQGRILNIIGKNQQRLATQYKGEGRTQDAEQVDQLAHEYFNKALIYFRAAEKILKQQPDQGGVNLGACYQNMADTEFALGHLPEAETLYRHALKILGKALGKKEPFVIRCLGRLAHVTGKRGKQEEAEKLYEHALKYTAEHLNNNEEHIYRLLTEMGDFYESAGNKEKAISCRAGAALIKDRKIKD